MKGVFFVFFCLLVTVALMGDTVITTDGRVLKGKITEETEDIVRLKTPLGEIVVRRDEIEEIRKEEDVKEQFKRRCASLAPDDAEEHYRLAQWCKQNGLKEEAEKMLRKTIEIDPDHEKARKELGQTKINGKWVSEEEMKSMGYVRYKGNWIRQEELQKIKEQEKSWKERKTELERKRTEEKVRREEEKKQKEYEGVPWEQAPEIKTAHFILKCNSTKKNREYYAWLLEALYKEYSRILSQFKPQKRRCKIYIFRNYEEFLRITRKPRGVGGFYMPGRYELYAYHGIFGITGDTTKVLAHECTHLFQDLIGAFGRPVRSPTWLIEGLAVVMEAADINRRTGRIKVRGVSRDRLMALQNAIRDKKNIPLRRLLASPQRGFGGLHYAHAGAFTYWLLVKAGRKYQMLYVDYLGIATGLHGRPRRIRPVEDFENLAKKYTGKTIEQIEEAWLKWVMKQKLERLGKMKGSTFVSKELEFQITRPKGWITAPLSKTEAIEAVVFLKKSLDARISVIAIGNMMNYEIDEYIAEHRKRLDRAIQKGDITDYRLISERRLKVCGLDAYEKIYDCKSTKSHICKELRRRARVYVVKTENIYIIGVMAPEEHFEEAYKGFREALETFKPIAK